MFEELVWLNDLNESRKQREQLYCTATRLYLSYIIQVDCLKQCSPLKISQLNVTQKTKSKAEQTERVNIHSAPANIEFHHFNKRWQEG